MPLADVFAMVDALVGLYLLGSLRRSQRHREAVLAVGALLLVIAGGLLWIGWSHDDAPAPRPVPAYPTGEL